MSNSFTEAITLAEGVMSDQLTQARADLASLGARDPEDLDDDERRRRLAQAPQLIVSVLGQLSQTRRMLQDDDERETRQLLREQVSTTVRTELIAVTGRIAAVWGDWTSLAAADATTNQASNRYRQQFEAHISHLHALAALSPDGVWQSGGN